MNNINPKTIWGKVVELVGERTHFNSWSLASGWLETEFDLKILSPNKIEVLATETRGKRILLPATFAKFAKIWPDYMNGKITRVDLKNISHDTTYVLPLMKLIADGE